MSCMMNSKSLGQRSFFWFEFQPLIQWAGSCTGGEKQSVMVQQSMLIWGGKITFLWLLGWYYRGWDFGAGTLLPDSRWCREYPHLSGWLGANSSLCAACFLYDFFFNLPVVFHLLAPSLGCVCCPHFFTLALITPVPSAVLFSPLLMYILSQP